MCHDIQLLGGVGGCLSLFLTFGVLFSVGVVSLFRCAFVEMCFRHLPSVHCLMCRLFVCAFLRWGLLQRCISAGSVLLRCPRASVDCFVLVESVVAVLGCVVFVGSSHHAPVCI